MPDHVNNVQAPFPHHMETIWLAEEVLRVLGTR